MFARISSLFLSLLFSFSIVGAASAAEPMTRDRAAAIIGEVRKITSSNGIDEARAVEIGGIRQWITVRGKDRSNPILLVIHGGPASPELSNRWLFEDPWTDYFTVVEWDQRGAGKTYGLNDPETVGPTITKERMIEDAEELTAWLRKTYDRPKIFVMAHSWGTILGLSLAQRHPDWLYAYIGTGQLSSGPESEKRGWAYAMAKARADRNDKAIAELSAIAPYPQPGKPAPLSSVAISHKWSDH
jgi:pimeloyl-ACP methyl ester carboxylesterase